MPDPTDTIIGSLPDPEDIESPDEDEEQVLPEVIMGSLPGLSPAPRHEINHQHFTPDGVYLSCRCGWRSDLCPSEADQQIAWLNHL